jgi:hypothetical protein
MLCRFWKLPARGFSHSPVDIGHTNTGTLMVNVTLMYTLLIAEFCHTFASTNVQHAFRGS